MDFPHNQIEYRWLKVVRNAFTRETNPDWLSPEKLERLHVESLNRLMCQHLGRECDIKHETIIALSDRQGYHILVAFDARQDATLEHAPIVGHARLVERPNLIESESLVEDVVIDSGFVDQRILRELVLRMEALSAMLGCKRMYLPEHIRPDGFPEEAPTKEHPIIGNGPPPRRVRQGPDLDAAEAVLEASRSSSD